MNRIWKYSLVISSILTILSANAELVADNHPGSGLYLGVGLQYNSADVDYTANTTFTAGIESTAIQTANISADGFSPTALLGYGFAFSDQFSLGVEIQGAININQEGSINTSAFFLDGTEVIDLSAKVKFLNNYGILLRPGYYLNSRTLLFLRGGYVNGGFETSTGAGELGGNSEVSQDKRVNGYLLGLGAEMGIAQRWSARLEYDYMHYQTINVNNAVTFPTPSSGELAAITATTAGQFSPQVGVFSLILTYTF